MRLIPIYFYRLQIYLHLRKGDLIIYSCDFVEGGWLGGKVVQGDCLLGEARASSFGVVGGKKKRRLARNITDDVEGISV